jgi:N-formylglutamate amidohydrolase
VAKTLTGLGYDVAVNDPYKGVELVRMHGRPAERRHSLQIEINRRLYMDESTLARQSGFATLQSNLQRLLQSLRQFVIDRSGSRA